ncbi:TFIIA-alpha and beta-like factor isoform X2 [Syngnathoides biaculeatus]|uniref:TFIIA-alpha and beta-like factor isoform X2 n=1 Tax=Syngnathoides biaculeatus TaxID=300417 RepID=UPI002ADE668F|nr:TFIIA-alpha and beta-like factor isoform X2 [Syngnathoides biaculeatus]
MGPMVAKLYLSIINDVIESMRELFLDEGIEDCILDNLRQLWETKMMESKTMDDFRKNNIDSPDFVLELPPNYSRNDAELTASVMMPASQTNHSFPVKTNSETLATFSLPAGLSYPVQIPAGVTLQTASGQLYKVNVPVVVTQAPAGQQTVSQPPPASIQVGETLSQEPPPAATILPDSLTLPDATLPRSQESSFPQQDPIPKPTPIGVGSSPEQESALAAGASLSNPEPVDLSVKSSAVGQFFDTQEALTKTTPFKSSDVDDILKEFIKEEREKAARARNLAHGKCCDQPEAILGLDLDFNYNELSDIVQLDGTADNSDLEEEEVVPLEQNDFLGIINAEAIKALQEGVGSSDGNTASSSSDSEGADELEHVEDEDPLNSGDDVFEQDIPDLFDSENVIVCQYDKIHRSKNRWKFHLKDGVMCYGGRDYVFSKAVGEAEW